MIARDTRGRFAAKGGGGLAGGGGGSEGSEGDAGAGSALAASAPKLPRKPVVCNPHSFRKFFKSGEFARLSAFDQAVIKAAQSGVRVIRARVPIDQGELRRHTQLEVYGRAPGAGGRLCAIIESRPYARAQEFGTRPFWAPFAPLYEWAKRQAPNLGLGDDKMIMKFARAVQGKIASRGITAKWFTRDAQPDLRRLLGRWLRRAARQMAAGAAA